MTVFGRDASDFDGTVDDAGLGFLTHKVTEGTSVVHAKYGPRLDAARAFGVPVLGAYHVLRTPGSGGAGSLAQQLAYWVAHLDSLTPWWRSVPFMLQVDAEKWPYDNVAPSTVLQFAGLLAGSGLPGYKVTYASRGQYGDSLRGIATDLWNADYRGSSGGSYPGDNWLRTSAGSAAGWAPFSGKTPIFLQYTSTPYDKDAYRGSLDQLLALTGSTKGATMTTEQQVNDLFLGVLSHDNTIHRILREIRDGKDPNAGPGEPTDWYGLPQVKADLAALAALLGTPPPIVLTDAQMAELKAQVDAGLAAIGAQLDVRFAKLDQAFGKALAAAAAVLETPAS